MAVSGNGPRRHCCGLIHLSPPRALSSPAKQGHHQLLTSQGTKRLGKVQSDIRESVLLFSRMGTESGTSSVDFTLSTTRQLSGCFFLKKLNPNTQI